MACEQPRMEVFYVPTFGVAPKWCNFLDNLTEELEEETKPTVYDDFKFITREEIEQLGLQKLIGTDYLRAYMHGYFVDLKLYKKVQSMVDPFAFERHRKEMIRKKLDEQQASRISVKRKIPKVNKELFLQRLVLDKKQAEDSERRNAERDQEVTKSEKGEQSKSKKGKADPTMVLKDSRFSALFENTDFTIDVASEEFQKKFQKHNKPNDLDQHLRDNFEFISEANLSDGFGLEEEELEEGDEEENEEFEKKEAIEKTKKGSEKEKKKTHKSEKTFTRDVKMYQTDIPLDAVFEGQSTPLETKKKKNEPLLHRIESDEVHEKQHSRAFGSKQISFIPEISKKRKRETRADEIHRKELIRSKRSAKRLR